MPMWRGCAASCGGGDLGGCSGLVGAVSSLGRRAWVVVQCRNGMPVCRMAVRFQIDQGVWHVGQRSGRRAARSAPQGTHRRLAVAGAGGRSGRSPQRADVAGGVAAAECADAIDLAVSRGIRRHAVAAGRIAEHGDGAGDQRAGAVQRVADPARAFPVGAAPDPGPGGGCDGVGLCHAGCPAAYLRGAGAGGVDRAGWPDDRTPGAVVDVRGHCPGVCCRRRPRDAAGTRPAVAGHRAGDPGDQGGDPAADRGGRGSQRRGVARGAGRILAPRRCTGTGQCPAGGGNGRTPAGRGKADPCPQGRGRGPAWRTISTICSR